MIVKNLTRKSGSGQLINYIFRYIMKEEKQPTKSPYIFRHNVRSNDMKGFVREFKENAKHRVHSRKDQVAIHHTILSWSNKDREAITEEKMHRIARHYVSLRGLSNLYVGAIHTDKEHVHLHIAMSATSLNGRASRISKDEFADLKVALDTFQQEHFPELINSLPEHGKAARQVQELQADIQPAPAIELSKTEAANPIELVEISDIERELAALRTIRESRARSIDNDFEIGR